MELPIHQKYTFYKLRTPTNIYIKNQRNKTYRNFIILPFRLPLSSFCHFPSSTIYSVISSLNKLETLVNNVLYANVCVSMLICMWDYNDDFRWWWRQAWYTFSSHTSQHYHRHCIVFKSSSLCLYELFVLFLFVQKNIQSKNNKKHTIKYECWNDSLACEMVQFKHTEPCVHTAKDKSVRTFKN